MVRAALAEQLALGIQMCEVAIVVYFLLFEQTRVQRKRVLSFEGTDWLSPILINPFSNLLDLIDRSAQGVGGTRCLL